VIYKKHKLTFLRRLVDMVVEFACIAVYVIRNVFTCL